MATGVSTPVNSSFFVYIDESGDEGFDLGKGSSEWFVISAVITRRVTDLETVKLVDGVRNQLRKQPKKPLHFRDLRHEQRLPYVTAIGGANLRTVSVLIHKPSIGAPESFQERYRLYFYSVRFLLERVSWYCRDHHISHDAGDGSAEVIFSNRSGMSYEELREYLRTLRACSELGDDIRIHWPAIRTDSILALTAGKRMGLQIADAVASSFYYAVQSSQYGFTEDKYARLLKPVVYHRLGRYQGYGLKLWPREVAPKLQTEQRFGWIREVYG